MRLTFENSEFKEIEAPPGAELADVLDGPHSPVFFGCKSGNCGTCLVEVDAASFALLPPPNEEEREILESMAGDKPLARLACQIRVASDMRLRYLN